MVVCIFSNQLHGAYLKGRQRVWIWKKKKASQKNLSVARKRSRHRLSCHKIKCVWRMLSCLNIVARWNFGARNIIFGFVFLFFWDNNLHKLRIPLHFAKCLLLICTLRHLRFEMRKTSYDIFLETLLTKIQSCISTTILTIYKF